MPELPTAFVHPREGWKRRLDGADHLGDRPGRIRLGRHVFAELFERCCCPVAGKAGPTAEVTALGPHEAVPRAVAAAGIDGFEIDAPDSTENAAEFGYGGSGDNRSAFPKARVVALAECGTHAFVAAEVDAYCVGEKTLAQRAVAAAARRRAAHRRSGVLLLAGVGHRHGEWGRAVVASPDPARPADRADLPDGPTSPLVSVRLPRPGAQHRDRQGPNFQAELRPGALQRRGLAL